MSAPHSSPIADELIAQGLSASKAGHTEEALSHFQRAAQRAPSSGVPHFLAGAELAQAGRMDEAEAAYATAVLLSPTLDMARYQLGLIQFSSGRTALALVTWEPLSRQSPQSALQRIVHGFGALVAGHPADAAVCFREGMALNQSNEALNRDIASILENIAPTKHDAASPAAAPGEAPAAEPPASEEAPGGQDLHVLLSNYRHQGPAH